MLTIPPELGRRYDTWLERKGVAIEQHLVSSVLIGRSLHLM